MRAGRRPRLTDGTYREMDRGRSASGTAGRRSAVAKGIEDEQDHGRGERNAPCAARSTAPYGSLVPSRPYASSRRTTSSSSGVDTSMHVDVRHRDHPVDGSGGQ